MWRAANMKETKLKILNEQSKRQKVTFKRKNQNMVDEYDQKGEFLTKWAGK